jgi:hypothetical protein
VEATKQKEEEREKPKPEELEGISNTKLTFIIIHCG